MTVNVIPTPVTGDFIDFVYNFIKPLEGLVPRIYTDQKGIPTLGVGYALLIEGADGIWALRKDIDTELGTINVVLSPADLQVLNNVANALNNGDIATAQSLIPQSQSGEVASTQAAHDLSDSLNVFSDINLISTSDGRKLFNYIIGEYIDDVRAKCGIEPGSAFDTSKEMVALISLDFNNPVLIGGGVVSALGKNDPYEARAETWYQIRYSHANQLWSRRYSEATLFSLTGNGSMADKEARAVYSMYTKYHDEIIAADTAHGGIGSLKTSLQPAATFLIDKYGEKKSFDAVNIFVSESNDSPILGGLGVDGGYLDRSADTKNVLLIGDDKSDVFHGGTLNDVLQGGDGLDILYGEGGDDTLVGGKDNDTLKGGSGSDTYIYKSGDGSDTIDDSDHKGTVKYDGTALGVGINREEGELKKNTDGGTFTSQDKKYTYSWSGTGTDLTINGSITVKNFNNGDMGITLYDRKKKNPPPPGAASADGYTAAQRNPTLGDPLTLDLDGDGIETVALSTPPLLFDINASGIKVSSGWISPDDGLLVMDRNGNGLIDDGSELFGDRTPVYDANGNPTAAYTANGLAALAQEDTNHDGVVNSLDANWASLRVWQDLNQDGISQTNELTTLDQQGIASFNTAHTPNIQNLANGNQLADLGSYTRIDGSIGASGVSLKMADINLALDTLNSSFTDSIPLTPEAQALPELKGSGLVRDLRQAASMQTAEGRNLSSLLTRYSAAATRTEQRALLEDLIAAWGDTSGFVDMKIRAQQHGYTMNNSGHMSPTDEAHLHVLEQFNGRSYYKMPWEGGSMAETALQGLWVGKGWMIGGISWAIQAPLLRQAYDALKETAYQQLLEQTRLKPYLDQIQVAVNAEGAAYLDFSAVCAALAEQANLSPAKGIGDIVDFNNYCKDNYSGTMWQGQGWTLLHDALQQVSVTPEIQAMLSGTGISFGTDGSAYKDDVLFADPAGGKINGYGGNDLLVSGKGSDVLDGGQGDDTYVYRRGDGADTLVDNGYGSNVLQFGDGIALADITVSYDNATHGVVLDLGNGDTLNIGYPVTSSIRIPENGALVWSSCLAVQQIRFADGSGITTDALLKQNGMVQIGTAAADSLQGSDSGYSDVLIGAAGDDNINGGAGNDILNGGAGNDTLIGGIGSDTYIYNLGDGADTIADGGLPSYNGWAGGVSYLYNNVLRFGAGIDASMLTPIFDSVTQTAVLMLPDGGRIDVGAVNDLSIQTLQFEDGSSISIDSLFAQQLLEQSGFDVSDVLDGTKVNDRLLGMGGDDVLNGGAGNDLIIGGAGNDTLIGGSGSDTYVYNLMDGADTIVDSSVVTSWGCGTEQNTLSFGTGITADMLTPRFDAATQRVMLDLGNGDALQIGTPDNLSIQVLQFADGAVQPLADFLSQHGLVVEGTADGDVLTGSNSIFPDHIVGGLGDDMLIGLGGIDVLIGGAGNDVLDGGSGIDTYVFNLGDGADTIVDDPASNNILQLGVGITPDTILPRLDGVTGDVRLDFGGGDGILAGKYHADIAYLELFILQVKFADGTKQYLREFLSAKGFQIEGTVADETMQGAISNQNRMSAFEGNDTLLGGQRDDMLDGGAGNDVLDGSYGNDMLTGGAGDDAMSGGEGNDVYVYNLGDGTDVVFDTMNYGQVNTVRLGAGADVQSVEYRGGTTGDLVLHFADGGSLRMVGATADNAAVTCPVQRFELADGSVLSAQQLLSQFAIRVEGSDVSWWYPQAGNDSLNGTNLNDLVSGYGGNDILLGGRGDDVVDGGIGNDTLSGDAGNDTLLGGEGNDTLYGREGDDVLAGGMGSDVLQGGTGNDVYQFDLGDGEDRISDGAGNDVLSFGQGIAQVDLLFSKAGANFYIALPNGTDVVVLENWFAGASSVNTLQFADGSAFDLLSIAQSVADQPVIGTAGDDIGVASLVGSIYNDTLEGGQGNDTLIGGTGEDVYRFNAGDGVDQLYELSSMAAVKGGDTLEFGAGITIAMLNLSLQVVSPDAVWNQWSQTVFPDPNADLMLGDQQRQLMNVRVGSQGDAIQVMSGKGAIEKFRFADGSEYSWQEMFALQGGGSVSDRNDGAWTYNYAIWDGTAWIPQTQMFAPHRILDGTGLAATFDGGIGNDTMLGGMQNDTYLFNLGDGNDVIADFGGQDEIVFGAGITDLDLYLQYDPASATSFVLFVGPNGDSISILDGEKGAIERFRFSDGSVLTFAELLDSQGVVVQPPSDIGGNFAGLNGNNLIVGTNGADTVTSGGDSSFIAGGKGDDVINLSGNANSVLFGQGDGQDAVIVDDYAAASTLLFGPDVDPVTLIVELVQWLDGGGALVHDVRIEYGNLGDSITVFGALPGNQNSESPSDAPRIRVEFADGTEWSYADLLARAQNMVVADPNNPTLLGTTGNDAYVIADQAAEYTILDAPGANNLNTADLAWDYFSDIAMGPLANRVTLEDAPLSMAVFAAKTHPFTLSNIGGSLGVQFDNGVTLKIDGFDPNDPLGSCAIRDFKFADGTVLGIEQVLAAGIETVGTDAADSISGTAVNDVIDGLTGDDAITGGKGNDVLRGGMGNDTYVFNRGDGADTIEDVSFYWNRQQSVIERNVLRLGAGIDPSAVAVKSNASNGKVYLDMGSGDSVCIGEPGNYSVQSIQFNDGTVWDEWMMTDRMMVGSIADQNTGQPFGITYSAILADGSALPVWLAFDGSTGLFSGTPANGDVGTLAVAVTATDATGNATTSTFALDVLNVNDAPTVSMALADQAATGNVQISLTVPAGTFDDVDFIHGDTLTYTASLSDGSSLPGWLSFDAATQSFSGTPANGDAGSLNISVTAKDSGGLFATSNFVVTVTGGLVNMAPIAANDSILMTDGNGATVIGQAQLLANDTDPDAGDTLSMIGFDATTAQGNTVIQNANGNLVLDIGSNYQSLASGQMAQDSLTYTITDAAGATSTATVNVTITGSNDAPLVVAAVASQYTDEDATFSYTIPAGTFIDIDQGDVLGYAATQADGSALPSWLVFDAATQTFSGTPGNGEVGNYMVTVTATDVGGLAASSSFSIDVANVNDAPVVNMAVADQSILEDVSFSFTLPADTFYDVDSIHGDSLSYAVTMGDGTALPAWLAFDAATQTFSGTPGNADVGTLNVRVTATDKASASVATIFALDVVNVNDVPVVVLDAAAVQEDLNITATGNLLANDTDVDQGTILAVANAGLFAGSYGQFELSADGSYTYGLDSSSLAVQSLAAGQVVTETFAYLATDGIDVIPSTLTVSITGANDAPVDAVPLLNQTATETGAFTYQLPANTFTDTDAGDQLTYQATLSNGNELPSWLSFDNTTLTFASNIPAGSAGLWDVNVTAKDASGASASSFFSLNVTAALPPATEGCDDEHDREHDHHGEHDEEHKCDSEEHDNDHACESEHSGHVARKNGKTDGDRLSHGQDHEAKGCSVHQIAFNDWCVPFATHNVINLRMLNNHETQTNKERNTQFDFGALVGYVDQAVSSKGKADHWALTNALLCAHLSQSSGDALGGDIAYHCGQADLLSAVPLNAAHAESGNAPFSAKIQHLHEQPMLNQSVFWLG